MVVEKILGKLSTADNSGKRVDTVSIDWFERDKKLLRKTTSAGDEIGIKIESTLNEGDIIYQDQSRIIAIEIAPSDLISVSVSSMQEMGKLGFELGNRHLSLSISADCVKCPFDEPTFEYLKRLGFNAKKVHEKFTGYTECKGHTHSHEHEHHHHE